MSNPNKARGTRWESEVVRYLGSQGLVAVRNAQAGHLDVGDIALDGRRDLVSIEAKDWAKPDLPLFVEQANRQAVNAGARYGVAVVKRRRKGAAHAYVVMDLETFSRILLDLLECPPPASTE